MKKKIVFVLALVFLYFALNAGTFYIVKDGRQVEAGIFNSQEEFVKIIKKHMAAAEDLQEEIKGVYGLMFFVVPAPKDSVERVVEKRIHDFFKYPEKYGFTKDETARLYRTKEELLKSQEIKLKTKKHGHYEVFIIGIDVKYDRMHSISKANGVRIFLDRWYKD